MEDIFYHIKCKDFTVISQGWVWQKRIYSAPHVQQKGNKQWNDFFLEQEMKGMLRNIWLKPQISIHLGHESKPLWYRGPYPIPGFHTTHVYHLFTTISSLPPIYYHQISTTYLLPADLGGLPQLSYLTNCTDSPQGSSPHFPPSWHHRHYITSPIFLKHSASIASPQATTSWVLSCHTPSAALWQISHPTQCFPSPEAQHSISPARSHTPGSLPADPHSNTLTHADSSLCVLPSPQNRTTPHPAFTASPHETDTSIPCTSISSGGVPIHSGAGRHGQLGGRKNLNQPRWGAEYGRAKNEGGMQMERYERKKEEIPGNKMERETTVDKVFHLAINHPEQRIKLRTASLGYPHGL